MKVCFQVEYQSIFVLSFENVQNIFKMIKDIYKKFFASGQLFL